MFIHFLEDAKHLFFIGFFLSCSVIMALQLFLFCCDKVFRDIEESSAGTESERDMKGLFDDIVS